MIFYKNREFLRNDNILLCRFCEIVFNLYRVSGVQFYTGTKKKSDLCEVNYRKFHKQLQARFV